MNGATLIGSMLEPIVFELPDRRVPEASAWAGHIPFAMWLMSTLRPRRVVELGTHWGHSYFAMCQAVTALGLESETFAVDTWVGDEHAGFYGTEVYADVSAWNEQLYSGFSTLLRMRFDEAHGRFADASIDLLHIDGLHTYEAVRADFEAWLPKVANGGVVILHDTAERREGFGVYRFFEELGNRHPTFGFEHSHGLGVVAVGSGHPTAVRDLLDASSDPDRAGMVRRFFAALGDRVVRVLDGRRLDLELAAAHEQAEEHRKILADLTTETRHRQEVIGELAAEAEHRQEVIGELAAEAEHRKRVIDGLAAEAEHRSTIIEELSAALDDARAANAHLQAELERLRTEIMANPIARLALGKRRPAG